MIEIILAVLLEDKGVFPPNPTHPPIIGMWRMKWGREQQFLCEFAANGHWRCEWPSSSSPNGRVDYVGWWETKEEDGRLILCLREWTVDNVGWNPPRDGKGGEFQILFPAGSWKGKADNGTPVSLERLEE